MAIVKFKTRGRTAVDDIYREVAAISRDDPRFVAQMQRGVKELVGAFDDGQLGDQELVISVSGEDESIKVTIEKGRRLPPPPTTGPGHFEARK
jgi:hypothetical protein